MHEGDNASGGTSPPPAGPSDDSPPPAGSRTPRFPGFLAAGRVYGQASARRGRGLLIYLVVAVLAGTAGVGTTIAVRHASSSHQSATLLPDDAAGQLAAMNDEAVYNKVEPGIVDVNANLQYLEETAEGTGFVINAAAGLVLTNNHVIDGATSVTVTPVAFGQSYQAKVLGYDRSDDVALLQLQGVTGLKAVTIGDSSRVNIGTPVLAIGNEAGQGGPPTVAPGGNPAGDRKGLVNRDGVTGIDGASPGGRVDSYHLARGVGQWAAGVSWPDVGVGLKHAVQGLAKS
jgi:hypothetical protein